MKKAIFLFTSLSLVLFSFSCTDTLEGPDDDSSPSPENYLRKTPSVIENIRFVVRYELPETPEYGYIITNTGAVVKYEFTTDEERTMSPGDYDHILSFFDNTLSEPLISVEESAVADAFSISLDLMDDYDHIMNVETVSEGAANLGVCKIHQVQVSGPGVDPVQYYPMRMLEGQEVNSWYVNTTTPVDLLTAIENLLSENNGYDSRYWEHYIPAE